MKIKLKNGTELTPILVTGNSTQVQGARRDTLNFIFRPTEDMAELEAEFTADNCETITIVGDNGSVSVKDCYTIRAKLEKSLVEVEPATPTTEAVVEERITVSMAQRTYAETQLASLTETVDVLVMESLMA